MALAAYRHLLRATRIAFQGDTTLLHAARAQCRHDFSKNAHISPTSPEASEGIKHAEDVAKILRMNVVQGEKDGETGNIKLRIHDEIERGDNETIQTAGKGKMSSQAGCCQA